MIDIEIYKSKRSVKYFQRTVRTGETTLTRPIALADMTAKERSFIYAENLVLRLSLYKFHYIPLNI